MSGNSIERATDVLRDPLFQRELHRLLWIQPHPNNGEVDAGWSCRDHAVVTGLFLVLQGEYPDIMHGRSMFVQGPDGKFPPIGFGQPLEQHSGHTWLDIPGKGVIDLSPNLATQSEEVLRYWRGINFGGIVMDGWLPSGGGKLVKCDSPGDYINEINKATHVEGGVIAVYFEQRRESAPLDALIKAAQEIDSPLSDGVYKDYGRLAYIAAVAHLKDFVAGRSRAIAGVSQHQAWQFVLSRYPDPLAAIHQNRREGLH